MFEYTEPKAIEVKVSAVSQDIIDILEGVIDDLTPVDPDKFMWMVTMDTLRKTIDTSDGDSSYDDAYAEEWGKFVSDCEATGCQYILIVGG
ncbi:MAG: hypothetical protein PHT07_10080 [Paludibacter sp.]|nr:hypothetical protein [Paludibacter sp.]